MKNSARESNGAWKNKAPACKNGCCDMKEELHLGTELVVCNTDQFVDTLSGLDVDR